MPDARQLFGDSNAEFNAAIEASRAQTAEVLATCAAFSATLEELYDARMKLLALLGGGDADA